MLGTIHDEGIIVGLRYSRARIGRPLLIVWDHLNAHCKVCVREFLARHPEDYQVDRLPGYAPELNPEEQCNNCVPEEQCNNCVKVVMLNTLPRSDEELRGLARINFQRLAWKPHLLHHFFARAGLSVT